ncbi:hypothetical protein LEP1GSC019_2482 [Leptospira interrogans serovar Pyrogenes str. 2006006960]|nr:hypothetical protein LEP1GSC019_2482 [Leptospira interrogans serovar Pyrogenes str. 2006006960]
MDGFGTSSKLNGSNFSFYKTLFFPENQMWELIRTPITKNKCLKIHNVT